VVVVVIIVGSVTVDIIIDISVTTTTDRLDILHGAVAIVATVAIVMNAQ
jgi:hypothetical protein